MISFYQDSAEILAAKFTASNSRFCIFFVSCRLHSVLRSVQGNGDYDRLAQGVYENFLSVKLRNFSMNKVSFDDSMKNNNGCCIFFL